MKKTLAGLVARMLGQQAKPLTRQAEPQIEASTWTWALPVGRSGAWLSHARLVEPFVCEAMFALEPDMYVGPSNDYTREQWEFARVTLPAVGLARQFAKGVTTTEALGQEDALIDYYRELVSIAVRHGKQSSLKAFPYFRTQPVIIADGEILTAFSWNDRLSETIPILRTLAEGLLRPYF